MNKHLFLFKNRGNDLIPNLDRHNQRKYQDTLVSEKANICHSDLMSTYIFVETQVTADTAYFPHVTGRLL